MGHLKNTIDKLIETYQTKIIYRPLVCKGRAFVEHNLIVVDPELSIEEREQVILHEFGHIILAHRKTSLSSPQLLSKQEAQAEQNRIQANIKHYIKNTPKDYWNTYNFLQCFELDPCFEYYVEE